METAPPPEEMTLFNVLESHFNQMKGRLYSQKMYGSRESCCGEDDNGPAFHIDLKCVDAQPDAPSGKYRKQSAASNRGGNDAEGGQEEAAADEEQEEDNNEGMFGASKNKKKASDTEKHVRSIPNNLGSKSNFA